jgi:hypothetical protein
MVVMSWLIYTRQRAIPHPNRCTGPYPIGRYAALDAEKQGWHGEGAATTDIILA